MLHLEEDLPNKYTGDYSRHLDGISKQTTNHFLSRSPENALALGIWLVCRFLRNDTAVVLESYRYLWFHGCQGYCGAVLVEQLEDT
jgi:hypothetical protein